MNTIEGQLIIRREKPRSVDKLDVLLDLDLGVLRPVKKGSMPGRDDYSWVYDSIVFRPRGSQDEWSLEEPEGRLWQEFDFAMDPDDVAQLRDNLAVKATPRSSARRPR